MYRRIAVPIDGSATSALGVTEAAELAKALNARLRVIHVLEDMRGAPLGTIVLSEYALEQVRDVGRSILESSAKAPRAAGVQVECELIERAGQPPARLILESIRAHDDDLLVCGTHGRTGLSRVALGSTAEEILRHSLVPILLVPRAAADRRLRSESYRATIAEKSAS